MEYLIQLDRQLFRWAYQRKFRQSFLIKSLIFMGDGPFWLIVMFLAALTGQIFDYTPLKELTVLLMFGLLISNMIFGPFKTYLKRRRPYANQELQKTLNLEIVNRDPGHGSKEMESFPSGHVLWTTVCVSLICFQFGLPAIVLFGWMIPAMMYLRPYLGVHYPSDVLAGLIIGSVNALITGVVSPVLIDTINDLQSYAGYYYGYWVFICIFLIIGFKSWLKRV